MSGAMSRRKGAQAERELFKRLNQALGYNLFRRNLVQSRQGGADAEDTAPVALEVKRQEKLSIGPWLKQAVEQAGNKPAALAYRRSHEAWKFLVEMTEADFVAYVAWRLGPMRDQQLASIQAQIDAECGS